MLPILWNPIRGLDALQRELDEVFRSIFGEQRESSTTLLAATPAVNSVIKDGVFHLEAELLGVDAENLGVRLDGTDLTIKGERRLSSNAEESDYLVCESRLTSFEHRLALPEGADTEKVHATSEDGLLEITMPIALKNVGGRKTIVEGLDAGKKSKDTH